MTKIWIKDGKFTVLNKEDVATLDAAQLGAYSAEKVENDTAQLKAEFTSKIAELEKASATKEEVEAMTKSMNDTVKEMTEFAIELKALTEKATKSGNVKVDSFKEMWDSASENIEKMATSKTGSQSFELKASQTYGDITSGADFAQFKPGITDLPVRAPLFRNLFGTIPLSGEFLKYTQQTTVIRDAQNVAVCTPVSSTSKETLTVGQITTRIVKDMMDFCIDFVNDYPFMRSRINKLISDSIVLKVDEQILLGTGTGLECFSIDSVSSEFSAANTACILTAKIPSANLVDLVQGMETQIVQLGEQASFMPDTVAVSKCDWFILVESSKDLNGNYLDYRVTNVNGVPTIGGMSVVWSPLVAQNTCYVFDSSKGEVIDRMTTNIDIAFQNGTKWESEIATIKGYVKINFLVESNNANAFMKCSDIAAAIIAINLP